MQAESTDISHSTPKGLNDASSEKDHQAVVKGNVDYVPAQRMAEDDLGVLRAAWRYRRIGFFCFLASLTAALDGYQDQMNGSILANQGFINQFSDGDTDILDAQWVSAWGGMFAAALFLAQVGMVFINDRYGRRIGLWVTWCIMAGSVLAESLVTNNAGWLGAKLLAGAGLGSMQATLPMYLNELAPVQIRGLFTQAYTFWFVLGALMASVALQVLQQQHPLNYKLPIYSQWAMIGLLAIIYTILPESPWWLVSSGRLDKARSTLARLKKNVPGYDVDEEVAVMKNTVDEQRHRASYEKTIPMKAIFQGLNGKRLIIALWPKLSQQFVGLSVFNSYAAYFFQSAGNDDPFQVTVILACCQIMAMIFAMIVVDRFGRRPLAVYGYMVTVVADFGMGAMGTQNIAGNKSLGSALVFFACLATFCTTASSATGYIYLSEIPKQDLRAKSAGWGLAIPNLFNIMFYGVTPIMIRGAPNWGAKTAFFFGCTGIIVTAIGWFIVPETARRTPAEIDEMFEAGVNLRKFKGYVTEVEMSARGVPQGERSA